MQGRWGTSQLVELVRLLVLNMDVLDSLEGGFARLTAPLRKALHAIRRNEGGFEERVIGDVQMLLVKPGNRRAPIASD